MYYKNYGNIIYQKHDAWGQFGDFIGGILNPLIALSSFIALLTTLWLQSEEIRKSELSRKANDIVNSLMLLERTIDPKMEHILSKRFTLPDKVSYKYMMAEGLATDLMLCKTLLDSLNVYTESASIVEFYQHKYAEIAKILYAKGYVLENVKKQFYPAGE